MAMYEDFFFDGNYEVKKPRKLDPPSPAPSGDKEQLRERTEVRVNTLYARYEKASDKANILMKHTEKVASKYSIPVPKESIELRQILSILGEDQNQITFALFKRCISSIESQSLNLNYDVIDTRVSADPMANERIIKRKLEGGGDDDSILLLVASQIFALYSIHLISGLWRSPETAATAPPFSIPESIRQAVVGLAASFAILGINESLANALADGFNTIPKETIQGALSQAKQVKLPPLIEKAREYSRRDYYKAITSFCIRYVSSTQEPGYEFWLAYIVAAKNRYIAQRQRSLAPQFSSKHRLNEFESDRIEDPVIGSGSIGGFNRRDGIQSEIARGLVDTLNRAVTLPTDEYLCAQEFEISNIEYALNGMAQILDTKFTRDLICCLVRFFGPLDKELLKKIRAILSAYLNFVMIDLNATMINFEAYLVSWIKDTFIRLILSLINSIIDHIVSTLIDFVNDLIIDINALHECPLVLEAIQAVIDGIMRIMADLKEIASNYAISIVYNSMISLGLNDLDAANTGRMPGMWRVHDKRNIRRIIRLLDKIIQLIDSGNTLCDAEADHRRSQITYDEFIDNYGVNDDEQFLELPQPIKENYFKDAVAISSPKGSYLPPLIDGYKDIGDPNSTNKTDCMTLVKTMLPPEIVAAYGNTNGIK